MSICRIVILGADLLVTTQLSPCLKDFEDANGTKIILDTMSHVSGMDPNAHLLPKEIMHAHLVIIAYDARNAGSGNAVLELASSYLGYLVCKPVIALGVLPTLNSKHECLQSIQTLCFNTLLCPSIVISTSAGELAASKAKLKSLFKWGMTSDLSTFVRATKPADPQVETGYQYRQNEVFLCIAGPDSAGMGIGTLFDEQFQFLYESVEVLPSIKNGPILDIFVPIVTSIAERGSDKTITMYPFRVSTKRASWTISHRFNDCYDFKEKIQSEFSNEVFLEFPSKSVLSLSATQLENRRIGIEKYFQDLICRPEVVQSKIVEDFFQRSKNEELALQRGAASNVAKSYPVSTTSSLSPRPTTNVSISRINFETSIFNQSSKDRKNKRACCFWSNFESPTEFESEAINRAGNAVVLSKIYKTKHFAGIESRACKVYKPIRDDELKLEIDQPISVWASSGNWMYGEYHGVFGAFPSDCVKLGFESSKMNISLMQTVVEGDGKKIKQGQTVCVHVEGSFLSGEIFESTLPLSNGTPISFVLGKNQILPILESMISEMSIGEQVRTIIIPKHAYGSLGWNDSCRQIPPNAVLIYDICVVSAS